MKEKITGERLMTSLMGRDSIEHLHRYSISETYCENKVVLDIACGEGYGSSLLSKKAKFVYGVDIDEETIRNAQVKYEKPNTKFKIGSTSNIPLKDNMVDVVVSFETIEHHDEHEKMINEIKRVLKPDGLVIISTPDKLIYSDKRNFNNKFHVKELYKDEFKFLLNSVFDNIQLLSQKYFNGVSLIEPELNNNKINFFTGSYNNVTKTEINPFYHIILASDKTLNLEGSSIFDGTQITIKNIQMQREYIYKSNTYKFGDFLLKPFKLLKKSILK
jgi:ubiquinone/menaquinone biosynthesis C-methylase UbiE